MFKIPPNNTDALKMPGIAHKALPPSCAAIDVEVRVWDSTAEVRYLVLPERPVGTEGMTEEQLAALVTRDSMIGTALVAAPGSGAKR